MVESEFAYTREVLEHFLNQSTVLFIAMDKKGQVHLTNSAFQRLVGEKKSYALQDFLEEKDISGMNEVWKRALDNQSCEVVDLHIRDVRGVLKSVKAWLYPASSGVLLFGEPTVEEVEKYKGAYLRVVSEIDRIARENQQLKDSAEFLRKKLEQMETTDMLTGVSNRKSFKAILDTEWSRAIRYNHPFSLISFDIDRLKEVNETYGPDTGDTVIVESVKRIRENLRMSDIIGRYEGGTFFVLLPETNAKRAYPMAERMRILIQGQSFFAPEKTFQVTATFGLTEAFCVGDDDSEKLIHRCLQALHKAKAIGKNRIEVILY